MEFQASNTYTLQKTITDELVKALGARPGRLPHRVFEPLISLPARRFAGIAANFDRVIGDEGICAAARWILPMFTDNIAVSGGQDIPREGPLLVVSNHPGTFDGLVVAANLPRSDLKAVVSGNPFFRSLTQARNQLIFSTLDTMVRMNVIRSSIDQLQSGGSLLIMPSGTIDPDPAIMDGAEAAIDGWSSSIEIFLRKVPETWLQIAIVSGVLDKRFLNHPFTRLRSKVRDRQRISEFLQTIWQVIFSNQLKLSPRLTFGKPIPARAIVEQANGEKLMPLIIRQAKHVFHEYQQAAGN